jgi:hypothetical protein
VGADGVEGVEAVEAGFASVFVSLFASLLVPLSVEVVPFDSLFLADPPGEAYRSEYHPPPLRMKLVPPLISRCAADFEHLGHTSVAASVIRWTSSHWWEHAEQAYSYVGIALGVRHA